MLKHLGAMGFARGLTAVSQAVLLILLARDVGPHVFGVIASFLAAHTFLFLVAGMNTPTFVTREIALGEFANAITSIRLNAIVMAVAMMLALASSLILTDKPLLLLAVAGNAVAVWSERVTENRLAVAYGEKRIKPPVTTLVIRSLVPLALYLSLAMLGLEALIAFAVARVVAGLVSQLLGAFMISLPRVNVSTPARVLLRAQAPLATSVSMGALRTLDSVLVIAVAGAAVSGIYSAVSRVVSPFGMVAVAAAPVLVPRAAHATSVRVSRILDGLLLAGLALSAMTVVLLPIRESLVVFVLGPEFAGGGAVLLFVLLRVGPYAAAPLLATALQAKGFDHLTALNDIATSVLALVTVAVGAILGGATGAAAGFAVVSLLGMVALWITGRRALANEPPADSSVPEF
jgi:O-antigen/teichoic acid export membrane protein